MTASTSVHISPGGISYRDEIRRKLVHLSSLWMPLAMCFLPRWPLAAAFLLLFLLSLLVERARSVRMPIVTPLYDLCFGGMLRQEPVPGQWIISGGPYVLAAAALSLGLFEAPAAAAAMTTMLLGDTAAALVGRAWGRHRTVNRKSLEGVAAFLIAGYLGAAAALALCGAPATAYLWALAGIGPAAAAELFEKQLRFDDNFSIPLVMGCFLSIPLILEKLS